MIPGRKLTTIQNYSPGFSSTRVDRLAASNATLTDPPLWAVSAHTGTSWVRKKTFQSKLQENPIHQHRIFKPPLSPHFQTTADRTHRVPIIARERTRTHANPDTPPPEPGGFPEISRVIGAQRRSPVAWSPFLRTPKGRATSLPS